MDAEFKEEVHSRGDMLLEKVSKVVEKSDIEELSTILKSLPAKTEESYLIEVVSALPTDESISYLKDNAYTEEHLSSIKRIYQSLSSTTMGQISNSSSSLQDDFDKMKEAIASLITSQDNITYIMESIENLPARNSFENIINEVLDIATEDDLQSAEDQIVNKANKLKDIISEENLKLTNLLTQEDSKELILLLSSIMSQQDLENFYTEVKLLSSENSVNELGKKLNNTAKKDEFESMGVFVDDSSVHIKEDLKSIMDQMHGIANKEVVKVLENYTDTLEKEINSYNNELLEQIAIAEQLLQDLETQDELINALDSYISKLSTSEALKILKELLLATNSAINASLEYVEGQEFISSKPLTATTPLTDCIDKSVIEDSMIDLHSDIDSICKSPKLQDLVINLQSDILQKIGNISLAARTKKDCQAPSNSQLSSKTPIKAKGNTNTAIFAHL
ncbi:unnamed protein product [Meganyctiphanes norvegica]|uniref:Flagellar hook-length control protein FliK n=1 Tax=Meganyctiphanes norvegica TaxID=48144 RepID=A0AAV2SHP8_MEGNR